MAKRLVCWPISYQSRILAPASGIIPTLKPLINCQEFSDLHGNLIRTKSPGSISLLDREIYQRVRVSRVADTELIPLNRTPQSDHQVQFLS